MAGLLDIFGTGGADTLGLLGMSQADIQRARDDAQAQALYGLAGRLFQGGNTGASIAQGLQQGQQLYKQAMQGQLQEQMTMAQLQELQRKKKEEALAKALFMQGYQPQIAGVAAQPVEEDGRYIGETPGVAAKPARFDLAGVAPQLMALGGTGQAYLKNALDMQKAMAGDLTKLGEAETLIRINPLTGEKETVASGTPKEKAIQFQDLGNVVIGIQGGKEVMRLPKGRAPEGPTALQHVETDQGLATFNPRTGQLTPIVQGGKPVMGKGAGQLTEGQSLATGFGMRMAESNKIIESLAEDKTNRGALIEKTPFVGQTLGRVLPSALGGTSASQQQFNQAKENFITAILRKESGAAIGPDEFEREDRKYFPQVNDDQKTIDQKAKARQLAIKAMKLSAGPGAKYIGQETGVTSSGW